MKDFLNRDDRGPVPNELFIEFLEQDLQARLEGRRRIQNDHAVRDMAQLARAEILDDAESAEARAGIDAEDAQLDALLQRA